MHIHVEHGDKVAKYWLDPVQLESSHGFHSQELNRLRMIIIENRITFQEAWRAHFGS